MKRAQLLGFGVAGAAALLAFVTAKNFVKPPPAPIVKQEQIKATEVLVASADISLGQIANDQHFRWQVWPEEATAGFITKMNGSRAVQELSGSIARAPIMAGEPISPHKLIKAGQGGVLAAILSPGMRAISTKIEQKTAVGGLVLPNDHVDVILTRRLRGRNGQDEAVSDTLFRNVRVLAIGQQIETKEGKKAADASSSTTTATLELTPRQTELLALANTMGEISLALRSVADLNTESGPSAENDLKKQRGNAIRILRYGVRSRAYGVN